MSVHQDKGGKNNDVSQITERPPLPSGTNITALIERLEKLSATATVPIFSDAAAALKALQAERDAAQSLADDRAGLMEQGNRIMEGARTELARVQAERDALREALADIHDELAFRNDDIPGDLWIKLQSILGSASPSPENRTGYDGLLEKALPESLKAPSVPDDDTHHPKSEEKS